ncbi:MAG: class I SAM-dependent methyltransferase [Phycisphaerae bacterium]|nr:class I SAM-dependent methyltransferase [Phycisphaerae bacterium]
MPLNPSTALSRRTALQMSEPGSAGSVLHISERELRRIARERGPRGSAAWIWAKRAASEHLLRLIRHIDFRESKNTEATAEYAAMDAEDLAAINRLQSWANWRTIPRNLSGRLPNRPVRVVDLCCGVGESTAVLAWYTRPGSTVLGLELQPAFVEQARAGTYIHSDGRRAGVAFRVQSVLETFRDEDGATLETGSVDLVHAIGAIGRHFTESESAVIADETARVLREGGLAILDCGPDGTSGKALWRLFRDRRFEYLGRARSHPLERAWQLAFRKGRVRDGS